MTPLRQFLETTLLPTFAQAFDVESLVLNIGAGKHAYREYFRCLIRTADIVPGCDETFPAEAIPYPDASVDGILFNGVFERLDDPMQAMREVFRVLKPGGTLLFSALNLNFEWHSPLDRWRLTRAGARHVVRAFQVIEEHWVGHEGYFYLLRKA